MPKKFFKRITPSADYIRSHKSLGWLTCFLKNANLWHLNRASVATALSIGIFVAFMPIPFQMLLAGLLAIALGANLPISIAAVWISNPLTMPAMFYGAYKLGSWVLWQPPLHSTLNLTWDSLLLELNHIWQPLFVGAFLCGLSLALTANVVTRLLWRFLIIRKWQARKH